MCVVTLTPNPICACLCACECMCMRGRQILEDVGSCLYDGTFVCVRRVDMSDEHVCTCWHEARDAASLVGVFLQRAMGSLCPIGVGQTGGDTCSFSQSRVGVTLEGAGGGWARCPCQPAAPLRPPLQPTKP